MKQPRDRVSRRRVTPSRGNKSSGQGDPTTSGHPVPRFFSRVSRRRVILSRGFVSSGRGDPTSGHPVSRVFEGFKNTSGQGVPTSGHPVPRVSQGPEVPGRGDPMSGHPVPRVFEGLKKTSGQGVPTSGHPVPRKKDSDHPVPSKRLVFVGEGAFLRRQKQKRMGLPNSLRKARDTTIALGAVASADGSALAKIGSTTMLAANKMEVMTPSLESPDEGCIGIDFYMPPIVRPGRPGWPAEAAPVLSKQLSDTITRHVNFVLQLVIATEIWILKCFRIVHAPIFLHSFASDRRHMKDPAGNWIAEPPSYEPIVAEDMTVHNLNEYIEIGAENISTNIGAELINDVSNKKLGVVMNENQLEEFFS
ncbi:hypothetical protein EZV62_005295 [Acer yangbiense]|uniref:Protein N-terminal glutamine amidohydrolase n=1 Tax=Acer yangbiense TaxID=1000413 RepID=A0A5C7IMD9_9ROSI|nr:hypothetical protein EZV62_005295 [Acer yangbiense]